MYINSNSTIYINIYFYNYTFVLYYSLYLYFCLLISFSILISIRNLCFCFFRNQQATQSVGCHDAPWCNQINYTITIHT